MFSTTYVVEPLEGVACSADACTLMISVFESEYATRRENEEDRIPRGGFVNHETLLSPWRVGWAVRTPAFDEMPTTTAEDVQLVDVQDVFQL